MKYPPALSEVNETLEAIDAVVGTCVDSTAVLVAAVVTSAVVVSAVAARGSSRIDCSIGESESLPLRNRSEIITITTATPARIDNRI